MGGRVCEGRYGTGGIGRMASRIQNHGILFTKTIFLQLLGHGNKVLAIKPRTTCAEFGQVVRDGHTYVLSVCQDIDRIDSGSPAMMMMIG